jgi:hypothetical protein
MSNPFLSAYGWTVSLTPVDNNSPDPVDMDGIFNIGQSERGTCAISWFYEGEGYGIGNLDLTSENGTSTLAGEHLELLQLDPSGQITSVAKVTQLSIAYQSGPPATLSGTIDSPADLSAFHILTGPNGTFTAQANTTPPIYWDEAKRAAQALLA